MGEDILYRIHVWYIYLHLVIWLIFMVNIQHVDINIYIYIGKYTIHGSYGYNQTVSGIRVG